MKASLFLCLSLGLMAARRVASEGCESTNMYPCNNGICLTGDPKYENKVRAWVPARVADTLLDFIYLLVPAHVCT